MKNSGAGKLARAEGDTIHLSDRHFFRTGNDPDAIVIEVNAAPTARMEAFKGRTIKTLEEKFYGIVGLNTAIEAVKGVPVE